uniref:Peptidase A1 domain-containing protein n=1 Tax=Leersia perrieri TaxID=77586 RepID=A0A0D9WG01_9ORYZ
MADRILAVVIATVSLMLVFMPGMVSSGFRFRISPKQQKGLRDLFKDHAADVAGSLLPPSPSNGDGSNNNVPTHAPATTTVAYFINFTIGSQVVYGAFDITSELVWVPCKVCSYEDTSSCTTGTGTPGVYLAQHEEIYACGSVFCMHPQNYCRGANNACSYTYTYGGSDGGKTTSGYLAFQNFTFGDTNVGKVNFGCGPSNDGYFGDSGVVGFNNGRFSLVTQLQLGSFSYYFPPEDAPADTATFFVVFGDDDGVVPRTSNPRYYTPFLTLPDGTYPNLYFVKLTGILVGGKDLLAPNGNNGGADAVLSTSVPVTYLEKTAYDLLKDELKNVLGTSNIVSGSALGLDLCYTSQYMATAYQKLPAVSFVFTGNAVMELKTRNYLYRDDDAGLECLTILPSQDANGLSVLGSLIQTGTHMIFDIQGKKGLSFESFDQPSPATAPPPFSTATTIGRFVWCATAVALACMFL